MGNGDPECCQIRKLIPSLGRALNVSRQTNKALNTGVNFLELSIMTTIQVILGGLLVTGSGQTVTAGSKFSLTTPTATDYGSIAITSEESSVSTETEVMEQAPVKLSSSSMKI